MCFCWCYCLCAVLDQGRNQFDSLCSLTVMFPALSVLLCSTTTVFSCLVLCRSVTRRQQLSRAAAAAAAALARRSESHSNPTAAGIPCQQPATLPLAPPQHSRIAAQQQQQRYHSTITSYKCSGECQCMTRHTAHAHAVALLACSMPLARLLSCTRWPPVQLPAAHLSARYMCVASDVSGAQHGRSSVHTQCRAVDTVVAQPGCCSSACSPCLCVSHQCVLLIQLIESQQQQRCVWCSEL